MECSILIHYEIDGALFPAKRERSVVLGATSHLIEPLSSKLARKKCGDPSSRSSRRQYSTFH